MATIDRDRLDGLAQRERAMFVQRNPRSIQAYGRADHLFGRVPMTWMNKNRRARVHRLLPG
jgi:glutamate-1-semialdehyde 2,1-aminomutase